MKITNIDVTRVRMPMRVSYDISRGPSGKTRDYIIVKAQTDEGITGIGESSPIPFFSYETPEDVESTIKVYLTPSIVGRDPFNVESLMEKLDHTVTGHPFAKGAVDMALYDIMGKSLNRPTYDLLGGRYRDSMPVPASIGITDANQAAETAAARVKLGFKVVKLKVGLDPKADIERVRAVREAVGKSIAIRIDANQGYTPDEAIRTIGKMEKYDLMLVEQPVPEWDLRGMCRVARAIETPVMADESVFSPQDAIRVVRAGAADIINIKIMKAGGIYNSKRIAAIAEAADLPCLLGGTVHGGICVAACSQIVASTKNVKYPSEGLSSGLLLADDVLKDPIKVENGMVAFNRKPGLGVEIDANKIEKYRVS